MRAEYYEHRFVQAKFKTAMKYPNEPVFATEGWSLGQESGLDT